jgi:hypothetical protein
LFIGHHGVGFAGKRAAPRVSLGWWFLAVQLVDLLWPIFLLRMTRARGALGPWGFRIDRTRGVDPA